MSTDPWTLAEPANMAHLDQPLFLLGHGVENRVNGSLFEEPAEWTARVSEHSASRRWDGPTDEAFERANWQFHGSLERALEELLDKPTRTPGTLR
jgi:hypothetical protein